MSVLLGSQIIEQVKSGHIIIEPFNENHVGPNSIDVTISNKLITYVPARVAYTKKWGYVVLPIENPETILLDMASENQYYELEIPEEGLVLSPGLLYLGSTNERAGSDYFIPMYEGRSSIARLGIQSHISAGFGDIFFKSNWTLEITVVHHTKIYPNSRIGQVYFHAVDSEALESLIAMNKYYNGKYTDQPGPQISKSYLDFK